MQLTGTAYAKINLSLDIISKMDDGYHSLKTVMQTVGLCDGITIDCEEKGGAAGSAADNEITVETNIGYIPNDERNIAVKAANVFFKHSGIQGYKVHISIDKETPICAGLGGGSADAACVLRMLGEMFGEKPGRKTLEKLAYDVGADVPFCISGGTQLAEGRGEILTEMLPTPACHIVICKPPFSCSTPELFKRVNCKKIQTRPDTDGLVRALASGDINGVAKRMYNVFEDFLQPRQKTEIDTIKSILLDNGALGAVMTGSGPTVFGVFDGNASAARAYDILKETYKACFKTVPMSSYFA